MRVQLPKKVKIEFAWKNEFAINDDWIPRGKLPTYYNEAIIDCITKVKFIESKINTK